MIKKSGRSITILVISLLLTTPLPAEIYRVVDKDGNVTYTDQPPANGAEAMDLPELSVIQAESAGKPKEASPAPEAAEAIFRALQETYSDFRILQPQNEETFWGTANSVVVSWGSEAPLQAGMTVKLYVDGSPRDVTGLASTSLQLERGTHQVHAELYADGDQPVMITPTVTFFVKQASIGFNTMMDFPMVFTHRAGLRDV